MRVTKEPTYDKAIVVWILARSVEPRDEVVSDVFLDLFQTDTFIWKTLEEKGASMAYLVS